MKARLLVVAFGLCLVVGAIVHLLRERPHYAVPPLLEPAAPADLDACAERRLGGRLKRADHAAVCAMLAFRAGCHSGAGDPESCATLEEMRQALRPFVCVPDAPAPPPAPPAPRSRGLDPLWPAAAPPPPPAPDLRPADPPAPRPAEARDPAAEHALSRVLGAVRQPTSCDERT